MEETQKSNVKALLAQFQGTPIIQPKPPTKPLSTDKKDSKHSNSPQLVLTSDESKPLLLAIPKLTPEYQNQVQMWAIGQEKMNTEAVMEMLGKSMDDFLAQSRDKYPIAKYKKFIAALPQSIRDEASVSFNTKTSILSKSVTADPLSETTQQDDTTQSEHKDSTQYLELTSKESNTLLSYITTLTTKYQKPVQDWAMGVKKMTRPEVLKMLGESMDDFLKQTGTEFHPKSYKAFLARLPESIQKDAANLFKEKQELLKKPVTNPSTETIEQDLKERPILERQDFGSSLLELTQTEKGKLAFLMYHLPLTDGHRIRDWTDGVTKMTHPEVLKMLEETMENFLKQQDKTQYPTKNYEAFLKGLPDSIRKEATELFQSKLPASKAPVTNPSTETTQQTEDPTLEHKSKVNTDQEQIDYSVEIPKLLPDTKSRSQIISWLNAQDDLDETQIKALLHESILDFLTYDRSHNSKKYPIENYTNFIDLLPSSIRKETYNSFQSQMWNFIKTQEVILIPKIINLPYSQNRENIEKWAQGTVHDEKSVQRMLEDSMDEFLEQSKKKDPQKYREFIDALPWAIREKIHQLFNDKLGNHKLRDHKSVAELKASPSDPPSSNCLGSTIAFFKNYPLPALTTYSAGMGISLGAAYLANPKGTKDFVTALPSGDSIGKFFNNALAVYMTPVVIVALIALISTGYQYKKQKDSIAYQQLDSSRVGV